MATREERIAPQTSFEGALLDSAFGEARVATRSAWRVRLPRGSNHLLAKNALLYAKRLRTA